MRTTRRMLALCAAAAAAATLGGTAFGINEDRFAQLEVEAGCKVYAEGEVSKALARLTTAARKYSNTVFGREGWLLAARIMQHDLDEQERALRELRGLALAHPRSPQGVLAQNHIALSYRRAGKLASAYREYLLLSKYPPIDVRKRFEPGSGEEDVLKRGVVRRFPKATVTAERANVAIGWASAHAIEAYLRMSPAERPKELPPRTHAAADGVVIQDEGPVPSNTDPAGTTEVHCLIAPDGQCFASAQCEIVGQVISSSPTPREDRHYSMIVEPVFAPGAARAMTLSRSSTKRETASSEMKIEVPARALRVALTAAGSRLLRWAVKPKLRPLPAGAAAAEAAPEGCTAVPVPSGGGYAPCLLHEPGGRVTCVYTDVGAQAAANPAMSPDLYLVDSPDGGARWSEPRLLTVSGATADLSPALVRFPEGPYWLFWISDRRGGGYMDIYYSTSLDTKTWSVPKLIEIEDLENMPGAHVTVSSVSAVCRSAELARVAFSATGTLESGRDGSEDYFASGIYVMSVARNRSRTNPERVFSTRDRRIEKVQGSPALGEKNPAVSAAAPVDVAWLGPAKLAVSWLTDAAGPYLSAGTVGGEWRSAYCGITAEAEPRVRAAIAGTPGPDAGVVMLVSRTGGMLARSSIDGVQWSAPLIVGPRGREHPESLALVSTGKGRCLAVWGHATTTTGSPLWAVRFREPNPPPRAR